MCVHGQVDSTCVRLYVRSRLGVFVCIGMSTGNCVCTCVCVMGRCTCVCESVPVSWCVGVIMCTCMYTGKCECVCVCVDEHLFVHRLVCMCVCVRVDIGMV